MIYSGSSRWFVPGSSLVVLTLLAVCPASAQVVEQYTFESGTQGWTGFNGATIVGTTSAVAEQAGTASLQTNTSSSGAGGPSVTLTGVLLPGATYEISGWVMLTNGEAATSANFTMKRTDASCSGGTCYDTSL
ncbi:MAG TPA: carbohydrate binding domain-containing protein [Terriglobales bacterium]